MSKLRTTALLTLLSVLPAMAQMDNVIDVEHVYKPEIKDANKINIQPEIKAITIKRSPVSYALTSVPVKNHTFSPLWAAKGDNAYESAPRRFVTIGGGTEGNILGRAAVGLEFDKRNSLDIDLGLRGHNAKVEHSDIKGKDWESRFYSATASVDYTHKLSSASSLFVKADYESQVYNYQQSISDGTSAMPTDKQHNTLAGFSAGVTPYSMGNFAIGGEAGYELFSQKYLTTFDDKCSEGVLYANANAAYKFGSASSIGLDLSFVSTSYSDGIDGYSNFGLRPHYRWSNKRMDIKAGVYVGTLGFAPDMSITYHLRPSFDIYADITGGDVTATGTFRSLTTATPYWALVSTSAPEEYSAKVEMQQQFNQLSARAGLRFSPFNGLNIDANAGYELSDNRMEFMPAYLDTPHNLYAAAFFADGNRFFVNANLTYNYKDRLSVNLANQFNSWTIDDKDIATDDALWRPVIDLDWSASLRIVDGLRIGADFRMQTFKDGDDYGYTRPTTANLGASVSYTLNCLPLTVYVKGNNLLNQDYDSHIGYRAPGTNVIAGAAITF